ncbi:unnamed protein product, partial [Chrysoparadoxa australica]
MATTRKLGLKDFIRRTQILHSYRKLLRLASKLAKEDPVAGEDVRQQIRSQFKAHSSETDALKIKMMQSDARNQVE